MLRVWSACVCMGVLGPSVGCFAESGPGADDDDSTGNASATGTATIDPSATSTTEPGTASVADTSDGSSDDASSGSTSGGEACPTGQVPNPPLPAGWQGPFVLIPEVSGPVDACPDGLTLPASPRLRSSPVAECECRCDPTCVVLGFTLGTDCSEDPVESFAVGPDCLNDLPGLALRFDGLASPKPCQQPTAVPPAGLRWDQHGICAGDQNSSCVPLPDDAVGPCIRSEGDVACPGALPRKIVGGQDATADCELCDDCNEQASAACAGAEVSSFPNGQCLFENTPLPLGECVDTAIENVRTSILDALECSPAEATTAIVEPVTYCCVAPA